MFEVQVWENVLEFGVVVRNLESKIQSIPVQLNRTLCICKFEKKRVDLTLFSQHFQLVQSHFIWNGAF